MISCGDGRLIFTGDKYYVCLFFIFVNVSQFILKENRVYQNAKWIFRLLLFRPDILEMHSGYCSCTRFSLHIMCHTKIVRKTIGSYDLYVSTNS